MWVELHITEFVKEGEDGFFVCPHCPFKIQVRPEFHRIAHGPPGVSHRGSTGGIQVGVYVQKGDRYGEENAQDLQR